MRSHEVKTSTLKIVYEEGGPKDGKPVLLLHGWPDSPRTWDKILPALHTAGYRTIAPYLRGYGPTEFRSPMFGRKPRRTGAEAAFAQDAIDLADKLKLATFDVIGHDWGARTAYALAAVHRHRLERMVTLSVPFQPGALQPPRLPQAQAYWYQWFLCSIPGEKEFRKDPIAYCRRQWDTWSPAGWYTEQQFAATAQSWTNRDFADVVLHSYRSRWGHAETDPAYGVQETRFRSAQSLDVPTLLLHGMEDHCTLAESTDGAGRYFTNGYRRILLDGVGHFPQRENPALVAEETLRHLRGHA
jgi:pimeloyl-ACP methyl ester carboxylesterase